MTNLDKKQLEDSYAVSKNHEGVVSDEIKDVFQTYESRRDYLAKEYAKHDNSFNLINRVADGYEKALEWQNLKITDDVIMYKVGDTYVPGWCDIAIIDLDKYWHPIESENNENISKLFAEWDDFVVVKETYRDERRVDWSKLYEMEQGEKTLSEYNFSVDIKSKKTGKIYTVVSSM